MSPITHLLASWAIAANATDNRRDSRLVVLAGVVPDADGLGLGLDLANRFLGQPETSYYWVYHHFLFHGLTAGLAIAALPTLMAKRRLRAGAAALAAFALHQLCDLAGSRGPSPSDLWPVYYLGPFSRAHLWVWAGQWELDAWPNRLLSLVLLAYAMWFAVRQGESIVGLFSRRADTAVVQTLRRWRQAVVSRLAGNRAKPPPHS